MRNLDKYKMEQGYVDVKWVLEENRFFSQCPNFLIGLREKNSSGKTKWLELTRYVIEDLKWLLELESDKFWSFMIFSKEAHELMFSVLIECSPCYLRYSSLLCKDYLHVFQKLEKFLFLIFVRLSTAIESDVQKLNNLGEILYNNYLFTVPVILDICLIYGSNNPEIVSKIIHKVIELSPNFLKDFQEMVPHFFRGLQLVKDTILIMNHSKSAESSDIHDMKIQSLLFFLHDSVATIEIFLNLYPKACFIFSSNEALQEIINFYSNILPEIQIIYKKNNNTFLEFQNLFEKVRLDFLKIVKTVLNFKANECKSMSNNKEEAVDEYLNMVQELLSEPNFLYDYNTLYSLIGEVEGITKIYDNVDFIKVNHILQSISLSKNYTGGNTSKLKKKSKKELECKQSIDVIKFNSLVSKVKDIFPSAEETFIKTLLKCHNYNVEKIISIILDSSTSKDLNFKSPYLINQSNSNYPKSSNLNESFLEQECYTFRDIEEKVDQVSWRDRTLQYLDSINENYEDEYDDSYDGNLDLTLKEVQEVDPEGRPFVIPRILRKPREKENLFEEYIEIDRNTKEENKEAEGNVLEYLKNPEELRGSDTRKCQKRTNLDSEKKEGQKKNVQHARHFKETHKSFIGNHNRKNQASRKRNF